MDQNNNISQDSQVQPLSNSSVSPNASQNTENITLPKWYSRFAAYLIDSLIISLILSPLFLLISFGSAALLGSASQIAVTFFAALLVPILLSLYLAYFQSKEGMTWGMKFIGLKISQPSGELLTFQNALFRALLVTSVGSVLSIIPFAGQLLAFIYALVLIVTILTDKSNQGFHDKMFNAVYSKIDEKTTRAKWVIGCYCGCGLITLIIGIIGLVAGLSALGMSGLSNEDFLNQLKQTPESRNKEEKKNLNQIQERNQEEMPVETMDESLDEINLIEEPQTTVDTGKIFYDACMKSAMNNQGADLSDYCKCAEEGYLGGMAVNDIVSKCQSRIKLK